MLARLLDLVTPPLCVACGADAGGLAPVCRGCRALMQPPRSAGACWSAFAYECPAGAVVRSLKFGGRAGIADFMAAQIAARAPALSGAVVPVPVHPRHRRRRGIDHTRALAAALARRLGLPLAECLTRGGDPLPQVGRGRRERIRGPAGAIVVRTGAGVPPSVVLVDDVVTTGATFAACITALRAAGTAEIIPIAYASTTAR